MRAMKGVLAATLLLLFAVPAIAGLALSNSRAETEDFGVPPTSQLRTGDYEAATPLTIPGIRAVIVTSQLGEMLSSSKPPLVVDVRTNTTFHFGMVVQGGHWWPEAGLYGTAYDQRFAQMLGEATSNNRYRPVVFYCGGPHCWLSYNAALRALKLGYQNVYWYRGGWPAWMNANGPIAKVPVETGGIA